jgi:diguanylate cyclase (GGDEF)-like protein
MDGIERQRVWRRRLDVRSWPLWGLRRSLTLFIVAVVAAETAALGAAMAFTRFRIQDIGLFLLLLAFGAAAIELTRRVGEQSGHITVTYSVWHLAIAVLLPPVYALLAPILTLGLTQWRIRGGLVYRRIFSAAAIGLSYGAASAVSHEVLPSASARIPGLGEHAFWWVTIVVFAGLIQWLVNSTLIATAVKATEPATTLRQLLITREGLFSDLAQLCTGVVFAFIAASNALLVVVTLPFVILLQRSGRHAELTHASRIDAKTGLLNASTWQRETAVQVTRAVRTQTPLAVAMLDLDHFKTVNDTYGHLTGDLALAAVADSLRSGLRDYDVAGRFGGEEFAVLLPHTGEEEATAIAERLREDIAALAIPARDAGGGRPLRLTISIGVATVSHSRRDIDDLLAAADHALYQAKRSGRNKVCVISDVPAADRESLGSAGDGQG